MNETHLVMHGLAVKKHGTAEAIAGILGLDRERGEGRDRPAGRGEARDRGAGQVRADAAGADGARIRLFAFLRRPARQSLFKAGYEGFERLNGALKQLITEWQTVTVGGERIPNDHRDKDYDRKIIDRLGDLHERAETVLDQLAGALPRMRIYKDKLLAALEKAEDGTIAWVSDAKIESYHTLWFELHEDLLRLMGREREE